MGSRGTPCYDSTAEVVIGLSRTGSSLQWPEELVPGYLCRIVASFNHLLVKPTGVPLASATRISLISRGIYTLRGNVVL